MGDAGPVVKIVQHFSGELVVCPTGCVAIEKLDPPESLDIPELLVMEPPETLVMVEDDRARPERPVVIAVAGTRVDLEPYAERIAEAERNGERVEVHVYPPGRA